jgi:tRNA dimethylallyltransferase
MNIIKDFDFKQVEDKIKNNHIDLGRLLKNLIHSKKVIVICGPTCTGKSKAGIILARIFNTDIISIDSMQVYKGMDIGTDKYNSEEYGVRQFMTDIFEPDHNLSVVEFKEICRNTIKKEFFQKNKIPIMVGGSGMYIRAVLRNIDRVPRGNDSIRMELKENIKKDGIKKYYQELKKIDKDYAQKISENDHRRIIRALEVYKITGIPFSELQNAWRNSQYEYDTVIIGLEVEKSVIYECIKKRVKSMFEKGLVSEVEDLIRKGYKNCNSLSQAVGYKEVVRYLNGDLILDKCTSEVTINTRRLAKKQMTWFRSEPKINWIRTSNYDNIFKLIMDVLKLLEKSTSK